MGLQLFNNPSAATHPATFLEQARLDFVDFQIIEAGNRGDGVISGGAVSQQATPNMGILVAAAEACLAYVPFPVAAQNVAVTDNPGGNPRRDLVVVTAATGLAAVIAGAAGAVPTLPDVPAGKVALAVVAVQPGTTAGLGGTIINSWIADRRMGIILPTLIGAGSPPTVTAGTDIGLGASVGPGPIAGTNGTWKLSFITGLNPKKNGQMVVVNFSGSGLASPLNARLGPGNGYASTDGAFIDSDDLTATSVPVRIQTPIPNRLYKVSVAVAG